MDKQFWCQKWENNDIGFHEREGNQLLVKHFGRLSLKKGSRVFLPLCGKSLDIAWLLSQGYRVAGAELSTIAVEQLFEGLKLKPSLTQKGALTRYSAEHIDIFAGDIFELTGEFLGKADAVYDRAALVALPEAMRQRYCAHLMAITHHAPQLMICFEYDQSAMEGPPFSIGEREVRQHYAGHYDVALLESACIAGGLKGKCAAQENAWLLKALTRA